MFTGLVAGSGEIVSVVKRSADARIMLRSHEIAADAEPGDSISVNGACLTVTDKKGDIMGFDLSHETLQSTNLREFKPGDRVNLEPSLKPTSRLGGHFVTGHIDGVGKIKSKSMTGNVYNFVIGTEKSITDFLVEKGSVAVDGISLTVVDVRKDVFSVVIIPHTAKITTLGSCEVGDSVNIEVDILGKYVSKFLGRPGGESFAKTLSEEGFI